MRFVHLASAFALVSIPVLLAACGSEQEPVEIIDSTKSLGEDDTWPSRFGGEIEGGGSADGYEVFQLLIDGEHYNVQTNPWGGAEQTITAGGDAVFAIDEIFIDPEGREVWDVATFPSVYKGIDQGGNRSQDSNLPIAIPDIESARTGLKVNSLDTEYSGNTTYDVYFTHDVTLTGGPPDKFLMVWYDSEGLNPLNNPWDEQDQAYTSEGYDCASIAPSMVQACTTQGQVKVHGQKFARFVGWNGHADVLSYVPLERLGEWEFDLKYFIEDAIDIEFLEEDMYLQSIQAGFEVTADGKGLTVEDFYADVQGTPASGGEGGEGGAGAGGAAN